MAEHSRTMKVVAEQVSTGNGGAQVNAVVLNSTQKTHKRNFTQAPVPQ